MDCKIGQQITIADDFVIELAFGGDKLQVKQDDKGFVDTRGMIHYTTGQARGKIQKFEDIEVKEYDHENIAKMVFKRLDNQYRISDFLEDWDIGMNDFVNEIEDILSDIL